MFRPEDLVAFAGLLNQLFSPEEVRLFAAETPDSGDLLTHLPAPATPAELAYAVTRGLDARGLLGPALFARLHAERPRQTAVIAAVLARFVERPAPTSRAVAARRWWPVVAGVVAATAGLCVAFALHVEPAAGALTREPEPLQAALRALELPPVKRGEVSSDGGPSVGATRKRQKEQKVVETSRPPEESYRAVLAEVAGSSVVRSSFTVTLTASPEGRGYWPDDPGAQAEVRARLTDSRQRLAAALRRAGLCRVDARFSGAGVSILQETPC